MINRLFGVEGSFSFMRFSGLGFSLLSLFTFPVLADETSAAVFQDAPIEMKSIWVKNSEGKVVEDPQTSALVYWRGRILSIGDGSARHAMRLQLLPIDPATAQMSDETISLVQSKEVKNGCFSGYLSYGPDLEAVAADPDNDKVFIIATEDAYRFTLKDECFRKYGNTGSTVHPTLLLRAELVSDTKAMITHVKAVRFPKEYKVGNSPNDGIEGLVFGAGRTLYLGLEKDTKGKARVFEVNVDKDFWNRDEMAVVADSKLLMPEINDGGNHPINALAYYPTSDKDGFLFAAARNDNQIWILDTARKKPTTVVKMEFLAQSLDDACPSWEKMNNYSIEGMTFIDNTLYMINDPWKVNYQKNATCKAMEPYYKAMAPLLTHVDVLPEWVSR
ncbi:hypothetical protein KIH87_00760 [Paraneptunicella aestuarii]|uniref:hypothetical protein n=1 Tax=Paraneptunicella aestuarii TaxID=2831148 RepID=UPI001E4CD3AF|nr:hypothetical protein [Paraneptunicella aestuarii]UAA38938.1 hypothetical protein KIH87_00760 [Paraneptunicella aestuarii]